MKKVLIISLALLTISLQAQPSNKGCKQQRGERIMNDTPEQIAELNTKKMVLHLDLTAQQEKRVYALMLDRAHHRKIQREENKDQQGEGMSFEKRKAMLEDRIKEKKEFKSILTKEQFEKWEADIQRNNKKQFKRKKQK